MFRDIAHPFANGKSVYDITFEMFRLANGPRTFFALANLHNALSLELAISASWRLLDDAYGVGDHMSQLWRECLGAEDIDSAISFAWLSLQDSSTKRQRNLAIGS